MKKGEPVTPIQFVNDCPDITTAKLNNDHVTCERDPKFVVLFVMPAIVAVPGLLASLRIFPVTDNASQLIAFACILHMVILSRLLALLSFVNVTVMVDDVTIPLIAVMSLPAVNVNVPLFALSIHPVGAVSINVTFV